MSRSTTICDAATSTRPLPRPTTSSSTSSARRSRCIRHWSRIARSPTRPRPASRCTARHRPRLHHLFPPRGNQVVHNVRDKIVQLAHNAHVAACWWVLLGSSCCFPNSAAFSFNLSNVSFVSGEFSKPSGTKIVSVNYQTIAAYCLQPSLLAAFDLRTLCDIAPDSLTLPPFL